MILRNRLVASALLGLSARSLTLSAIGWTLCTIGVGAQCNVYQPAPITTTAPAPVSQPIVAPITTTAPVPVTQPIVAPINQPTMAPITPQVSMPLTLPAVQPSLNVTVPQSQQLSLPSQAAFSHPGVSTDVYNRDCLGVERSMRAGVVKTGSSVGRINHLVFCAPPGGLVKKLRHPQKNRDGSTITYNADGTADYDDGKGTTIHLDPKENPDPKSISAPIPLGNGAEIYWDQSEGTMVLIYTSAEEVQKAKERAKAAEEEAKQKKAKADEAERNRKGDEWIDALAEVNSAREKKDTAEEKRDQAIKDADKAKSDLEKAEQKVRNGKGNSKDEQLREKREAAQRTKAEAERLERDAKAAKQNLEAKSAQLEARTRDLQGKSGGGDGKAKK